MPQAAHTPSTARAELDTIRDIVADAITRLGVLSQYAHQPGLHIDNALGQIADVPGTLDAAIEELDELLDFQDALEAGEDWAVRQECAEAEIELAQHRYELAYDAREDVR